MLMITLIAITEMIGTGLRRKRNRRTACAPMMPKIAPDAPAVQERAVSEENPGWNAITEAEPQRKETGEITKYIERHTTISQMEERRAGKRCVKQCKERGRRTQ